MPIVSFTLEELSVNLDVLKQLDDNHGYLTGITDEFIKFWSNNPYANPKETLLNLEINNKII